MSTSNHITGNTTRQATPDHDLDSLSRFFVTAFPGMDADEQRLARTIYQRLAEGEALSTGHLARELGRSSGQIEPLLDRWGGVFHDSDGKIVGFWGIAVGETRHRMEMDGHVSYGWCAWDTLFIPELVGSTAQVTSTCAGSGETIRLTVSPQRVQAEKPGIVVSFLIPEPEKIETNIVTGFCHAVCFFRSREVGETWAARHPGTFLLTLDEAFAVGKKVNASRYANVL